MMNLVNIELQGAVWWRKRVKMNSCRTVRHWTPVEKRQRKQAPQRQSTIPINNILQLLSHAQLLYNNFERAKHQSKRKGIIISIINKSHESEWQSHRRNTLACRKVRE